MGTPWSRRSAQDDPPNQLGRAVGEARARGRLLDLTVSNPTDAALPYAKDAILRALAAPEAMSYAPEALGLPAARRAVGESYAARGIPLDPAHVAITASTSEAYAALFKLLADPGDEILVPTPSYPLLDWLASFESVVLRPYPLVYAGGWHVDVAELRRAVTTRTRAIVVVAPNNPTGSFLGASELEAMLDLGLPIVSDEVFATYPLRPRESDRVDTLLRADRGLVFALSGLSKLVALPQLKLGWIACGGERARADEAIARLDFLLDAYLSVGAPVQHALPELLRAGEVTADAIRTRTKRNLAVLREAARASGVLDVLDVEAGWYAIVRVPATETDETWALRLVREDSVYVHPGYFFDLHHGAHLVVSLLTTEGDFAEGVRRLVARASAP